MFLRMQLLYIMVMLKKYIFKKLVNVDLNDIFDFLFVLKIFETFRVMAGFNLYKALAKKQ